MMRELKMELSKYVPQAFEVGDLVQFINDTPFHETNQLFIINYIDWRYERITIDSISYPFYHFKIVKKNFNTLVKLVT